MTSRRGVVFPLTYWLTWLFPSFLSYWAAECITSAWFIPASDMACLSRAENSFDDIASP